MSPQTVNAYYTFLLMRLFFQAILQPPVYNYQADKRRIMDSPRLGICMKFLMVLTIQEPVIMQMEQSGRLEDLEQFTILGTSLSDQYSALEPLPGVHVDTKFTLGENR
jgi:endothelin-converting enzyme/putative endopeptidase